MYARIQPQGYGIKSFLSTLSQQLAEKASQAIESQLELDVYERFATSLRPKIVGKPLNYGILSAKPLPKLNPT